MIRMLMDFCIFCTIDTEAELLQPDQDPQNHSTQKTSNVMCGEVLDLEVLPGHAGVLQIYTEKFGVLAAVTCMIDTGVILNDCRSGRPTAARLSCLHKWPCLDLQLKLPR